MRRVGCDSRSFFGEPDFFNDDRELSGRGWWRWWPGHRGHDRFAAAPAGGSFGCQTAIGGSGFFLGEFFNPCEESADRYHNNDRNHLLHVHLFCNFVQIYGFIY